MYFSPEERGKCRIVGTPIGNLKDLTLRAIEALQECDTVFAEDTRTAAALLNHLQICKPVFSYHKDNEPEAVLKVLQTLTKGDSITLVSEAGMPGISDPGYLLIDHLIKNKIPFEIIPGVSACVHAAVASGLCIEGRYLFYGFLPHKNIEEVLLSLKNSVHYPIVFYESPHRLEKTVRAIIEIFSSPVAVCKELTKLYEEVTWIHNIQELGQIVIKGEFCLVVDNSTRDNKVVSEAPAIDILKIVKLLKDSKIKTKDAVSLLKLMGISRNDAYEYFIK